MGADFLLAYCRVPRNVQQADVETAVELVVARTSLEAVYSAMEDLGYENDEELSQEVQETTVREALQQALLDAAQLWFVPRRDTTTMDMLCPCGCGVTTRYIAAGGMSWRDEPEVCREIDLLDTFDLASYVKSDLQHLADVKHQ